MRKEVKTVGQCAHIVGVSALRLTNNLCKQGLGKEVTKDLAELCVSQRIKGHKYGCALTTEQKSKCVNKAVAYVDRYYDEINRH